MSEVRAGLGWAWLRAELTEACAWAENIELCLAEVRGSDGEQPGWDEVEPHIDKVRLAILSTAERAVEPPVLRALHDRGVLRVASGDEGMLRANAFYFRRGSQGRMLLLPHGLDARSVGRDLGVGMALSCDGDSDAMCSVRALFEELRSHARLPFPGEVDAYAAQWREASVDSKGAISPGLAQIRVSGEVVVVDDPAVLVEALTATRRALGHRAELVDARLELHGETRNLPVGWREDLGVWFGWQAGEGFWRLWIGDERPGADPVRALLEMNVPTAGIDHRFGGAIARDASTGDLLLVHRGIFRGQGTNERLFWANTRARVVQARDASGGDADRVALVAAIGSTNLPRQIAGFAGEARRIMDLLQDDAQDDEGVDDEPQDLDLPDESDVLSFEELTGDEQVERVWNILLGEGPLATDDAVRTVGRALRETGEVHYQRLRRGGHLYGLIFNAIQRGVRHGALDRPARGEVRAIQPNPDALNRGMWRECLLDVAGHRPRPREELIHEAADLAIERYGIEVDFRRGGRIENALRSAINSAIRCDMLIAVGRDLSLPLQNAGA